LAPDETRAFMVRSSDWKYVSFDGFPPQLFDLGEDPQELTDLGQSNRHQAIRTEMESRLSVWLKHRRMRTTIDHDMIARRTDNAGDRGYLFGIW
ncbi:MAG: hypothetical protein RLN80_01645, partial [Rhodospirillales bacterium]